MKNQKLIMLLWINQLIRIQDWRVYSLEKITKAVLRLMIFSIITAFLAISLISNTNASSHNKPFIPSNESLHANDLITNATICFNEMLSHSIPIQRANSSLQEAKQFYEAQLSLEQTTRKADYKIIFNKAETVCKIKEDAIKSKDELKIFEETYEQAKQNSNLSAMEKDYQKIINSFNEERFEETIKLINQGYKTLIEIEASQTKLRLFYNTITSSLKNFLKENWKKLSIISIVIIIILTIFWATLKRLRIKLKIRKLETKKQTLYNLIKKLQYEYFKTKKLSEIEFRVKIQTFKEMIRDIDRQIPLLKEEIFKLFRKTIQSEKRILFNFRHTHN